jgi:dienelactone hydrolase
MKKTQAVKFSPSEYHRYLMDNTAPSMHYSGGGPVKWQRRLRAKIRELVGAFPAERIPLTPNVLWKKKNSFGSIEKIVITSEKNSDMPMYFCLPKNSSPPYTVMICVQGHSSGMHNSIGLSFGNESKSIHVEGDRDFAVDCMKRGIAALCIEQRSFGERAEHRQKVAGPGCHDAAMHSLALGKTLLGERVFDVDRGIDYLAHRGDVDMKRIGVMGDSTGGTISVFSAALLPRISFAVPSCYFCTFRGSIMSIHHCVCNYVPGIMKYAEMSDVMGLFAPKPLVIVTGKTDPIFPISATRSAFCELRKIYKAFGAENNCRLVVGEEGHRFYADMAWPYILKEIDKGRKESND